MTTELTRSDLDMLQDALAFKLLYLKDQELTVGLNRAETLPIMQLAAKLEAMKEERDEDCTRAGRD